MITPDDIESSILDLGLSVEKFTRLMNSEGEPILGFSKDTLETVQALITVLEKSSDPLGYFDVDPPQKSE